VSESAVVLLFLASNADAAKSGVIGQNPVGSAKLTAHLRVHMGKVILVLSNMQICPQKRLSGGTKLQNEQPRPTMPCLVLPPL
jgi:hypothetical protein